MFVKRLAAVFTMLLLMGWAVGLASDELSEMQELTVAVALKYGIPPPILLALVENESSFQPSVRSHKGARSLAQVMPSTAYWMSERLAESVDNPLVNLSLGSAYLIYITHRLAKHRKPLGIKSEREFLRAMFGAYNCGPNRVLRQGIQVIDKIDETRVYVKRCLKSTFKWQAKLKKVGLKDHSYYDHLYLKYLPAHFRGN